MLKKMVIGSTVLVVVGCILVPGVGSHIGHLFSQAKSGIQNALPIEYELERAERMIEDMIPEIEARKHEVAEEQVEIRYLKDEIARLGRKLGRDAERIQGQSEALKTEKVSFTYGGRSYGRKQVEHDLRIALQHHRRNAALLASKQRTLEASEGAMREARNRLEAVCVAKARCETQVEELRARLRALQAVEATTNRVEIDDSSLARAKEILARCTRRLDVAQQVIENEAGSVVSLPEVPFETSDITLEVDRYFGEAKIRGDDADN